MFVRVYGYRVMYGLEQEGESGYGPTIFQWFPAQFGYHGRNTAGPSWIFADKSGRSALYSFQPVFVVLFKYGSHTEAQYSTEAQYLFHSVLCSL